MFTLLHDNLATLIFIAGLAQVSILIASSLVPSQLQWKQSLACLPTLHRQMYWVYAAYVVLSIIAFASISILAADEIAAGSLLARAFSCYVAIFWGIRLALQWVFDVQAHLHNGFLRIGYNCLSVLFLFLCCTYSLSAFA